MQDPVYNRIENTPRPSLFAASALILLAGLGLWASILLQLIPGIGSTAVSAAYYLLFIGLPTALYLAGRPRVTESMRLNPLPALPALAVALLAFLSVFAASLLSAAWGWWLDLFGLRRAVSTPVPETGREATWAILTLAALPAVFEELLFRGVALAAWESRGTRFAIAVTSALFALLHANLYGLPAYLLVGAISAFVTFALDSLYAGITFHTLYNAACIILPWLLSGRADSGAETGVNPFALMLEICTLFALMAMLLAHLRLWAHNRRLTPIPRIRRPVAGPDRLMLCLCLAQQLISLALLTALSTGGLS